MARVRFFKGGLSFDIVLGWDRRRFQALETQLFEKDADLRRAAFEPGELLNELDRLGDRGWWMLFEIRLQRVMMDLQFAGRTMKFQAFEGLNPSCLILLQIAAQRVFTDSDAHGDLMVGQTFGLQQQRFHLPLHTGMRMVIALVIQFFDGFFAKR